MLRNNNVLRSLRHTLHAGDAMMLKLFSLGGMPIEQDVLHRLLLHEEDAGYFDCSDEVAAAFLNGLIVHKRGPSDHPQPQGFLSNNAILKRLRIAYQLRDDDIHAILQLAAFPISKPELNALFRQEGHPNYRPCGDQLLRNFLKGLALRERR